MSHLNLSAVWALTPSLRSRTLPGRTGSLVGAARHPYLHHHPPPIDPRLRCLLLHRCLSPRLSSLRRTAAAICRSDTTCHYGWWFRRCRHARLLVHRPLWCSLRAGIDEPIDTRVMSTLWQTASFSPSRKLKYTFPLAQRSIRAASQPDRPPSPRASLRASSLDHLAAVLRRSGALFWPPLAFGVVWPMSKS